MFPVVVDITRSLELEPMRSRYGALLFICLAWGSVVGGIATLLGGARNPLAIGLLNEYYGLSISFFDWFLIAAPLTFIMLALAYIVLLAFFRIDIKDISKARAAIKKDLRKKAQITVDEKKVVLVMGATLFSWIFLNEVVGLANIALISSVSLFALGIIDWKTVEDYVNWGVILMYGGAIALGSALVSSGGAKWITDIFLENVTLTPFLFLAALALFSKFFTEGVSNAATVAVVLPIGFSVGQVLGINPIATVFIVSLPAGLGFMLPISSPPNAIAYSSGYYEISDVIKPGLILNILSWVIFIVMALTYWPRIGLNLM
jgi:sodium-dependent dicarboxylate transporter 2/3/5